MGKKKRVFIISFAVICLSTITLFFYLSTFVQPKITFTVKINKISEKDYKGVYPGTSIDKIREIDLKINIITLFGISRQTHIETEPSQLYLLQQYLKDEDKIRILGGGGSSQGGGMEYHESAEISLENISEDELRNILGDFRIKILWKDLWNNENSKIFYFKDYSK